MINSSSTLNEEKSSFGIAGASSNSLSKEKKKIEVKGTL
jgi:hypothetical protein